MTTFDEDAIKQALKDAANSFTISADATERILDEARLAVNETKTPRLRTSYRHYGRTRSTFMAVAASVVVLGVVVPLFNTESPAFTFSALSGNGHQKVEVGGGAQTSATGSISGTGFEQGSRGTASGAPTVVNTSSKTVNLAPALSITSVASLDSSLRVEEVGTIYLSVGDKQFEPTLTKLTDFATTDGGFVSSTRVHMGTKASGSYSSGSIVLQVPEHKFTMLVDQARHAGLARSVVTSATDVSGQYVDLQARISALGVSRAQYLKIMTRTNSIGGILSVQNQLNSIQSQIEQLQGQLGLLTNETTYSTLTVNLSESGHPTIVPKHAATGVDKAWHDSVRGFVVGVEWVIRVAGPLLFAVILLALLLALGRLVWRATERRRSPLD